MAILKPSVLQRISHSKQPPLDPVNMDISLADGQSLPFLGRGLFSIAVGRVTVQHEIWIADIEPDGILGMDFIQGHNCKLTVGRDWFELTLHGRTTCRVEEKSPPRCMRIAVALPFLGRGLFSVAVGRVTVQHEIWIADIEPDGILGMDFIQGHNCKLTVGRDWFELTLHGRTTCRVEEKSPPRCMRIAVGVMTIIPPKRSPGSGKAG